MNINKVISDKLNVRESQVAAAVKLLDEGCTVPFISRYRKEITGSLNDEQLRALHEQLTYLRNLEDRKQTVANAIEEQGKLTPEITAQLEKAETLVAVEDIYRPYKQKRRTRAMIARERGLEPLAALISLQMAKRPVEEDAAAYIDPEKEVLTADDAITGALDIIAENIADEAAYRAKIRDMTGRRGFITAKAKDPDESTVYDMYYDFSEKLSGLAGHRVLALNRGEKEKILTVKIEAPVEDILAYLEKQIIVRDNTYTTPLLQDCIEDSFSRLLFPSIEREIRSELTEQAEDSAIAVFGKNLTQLLMAPPIAGKTVLGWDPAFKTGCKLAVVDPTGKVLDTRVIYPTPPQSRVEESKKVLKALVKKYNVDLISLGNGTASRESEQVIAELINELKGAGRPLQYVIVNEAGASVYSASKLATEEFPGFDVGQRSAASIARRLQDPLAELVKIDPKAIGVGQYQHDMNQKKLTASLEGVVEDCVNRVGVDLNTASASLLEHISGITKVLAKNIVAYREENGRFTGRSQLLKVSKLGPKAYEQCAGFLRITGGKEVLDSTGVHPESYKACYALLARLGIDKKSVVPGKMKGLGKQIKDIDAFAKELEIGAITLADIVAELEKPSRDPRADMPLPVLKSDVLSMEDLREGMILTGTVRNVIDFGAFVDIGVHQDGLVHISQLADRYVKHPLDVVAVGDVVEVKVLSVDIKKQRIALTMLV